MGRAIVRWAALCLLLGAAVVAAPTSASAQYVVVGTPVRTVVEVENTPVLVTGVVAWAVAWVLDWGITLAITDPGDSIWGESVGYSFIPLAGPWLQMTVASEDYWPALVADGVVQAVGLILTIVGAATTRRVERVIWVELERGRSLALGVAPGAGGALAHAELRF